MNGDGDGDGDDDDGDRVLVRVRACVRALHRIGRTPELSRDV